MALSRRARQSRGRAPVIWIIDAEQWPRAMPRAELLERGFDAIGYITVRDGIDSLLWRRPRAIVVDRPSIYQLRVHCHQFPARRLYESSPVTGGGS